MLLITAACGQTAAKTDSAAIAAAHQTVTNLVKGDDTAVESELTATVKSKLSAARLAAAWQQGTAALGAFKSQGKTVSGPAAGGTEVVVTAMFTKGTMDVRLHFDAQKRIDGLYLQPHPSS